MINFLFSIGGRLPSLLKTSETCCALTQLSQYQLECARHENSKCHPRNEAVNENVMPFFDTQWLTPLLSSLHVSMLALQTLQFVLSEQSEDSCQAIFSPLSCPVLPASSHTPPFQRVASSSASLSSAVLDLVLVQGSSSILSAKFFQH